MSPELNFRRVSFSNHFSGFYANAISEYHFNPDLYYLRLNLLVYYRVKRVFLTAGFSDGFVVTDKSDNYIDQPIFGKVEWKGRIQKNEQGVILGLRYQQENLGAHIRFELSNGHDTFSSTSVLTGQVLLSYRF